MHDACGLHRSPQIDEKTLVTDGHDLPQLPCMAQPSGDRAPSTRKGAHPSLAKPASRAR